MYRLSVRNGILTWFIIALSSAIVISIGYIYLEIRILSLLTSFLSISLGFLGTIVIALPSILPDLGKNKEVTIYRNTSSKLLEAYRDINNGGILEEGSSEYGAMLSYLHQFTEYDDNPSTIVKGRKSGISNYIAADGDGLDTTLMSISGEMRDHSERIDSLEEIEEDMQERRYVSLGCGIYGLAIIFQSLSTLFPNISLLQSLFYIWDLRSGNRSSDVRLTLIHVVSDVGSV